MLQLVFVKGSTNNVCLHLFPNIFHFFYPFQKYKYSFCLKEPLNRKQIIDLAEKLTVFHQGPKLEKIISTGRGSIKSGTAKCKSSLFNYLLPKIALLEMVTPPGVARCSYNLTWSRWTCSMWTN